MGTYLPGNRSEKKTAGQRSEGNKAKLNQKLSPMTFQNAEKAQGNL